MKYELVKKCVPPVLYHITNIKNLESIKKDGIKTFCNPAVFLTDSCSYIEYLKNVQFKGECVVFEIDAQKMVNEGFVFYNDTESSRNIIWVTKFVPSKYISEKRS